MCVIGGGIILKGMGKEKEVQLVPLRRFTGNAARLDAELARGVLAEAGIECVIPGEAAADTFPFLDVLLLVRAEDLEQASEILETAFAPVSEDSQSDEDEDEEGDSVDA